MLPTIVKLFASNDRAIRVSLLQHVDQFGESMSGQIVDEQVSLLSLFSLLWPKKNVLGADVPQQMQSCCMLLTLTLTGLCFYRYTLMLLLDLQTHPPFCES